MPTPNEGESEKDFVSRCMSYPDMQRHEPKQRAAICYSKFRGEAVHPDFQRIISLFFKRYKVDEAIEKFGKFVMRNSLNLSKAYNPTVQFKESFEWIEPLIQPYKQDKDAKYYLVTALTADISMNNVDYGPIDRMEDAAPTLSWRPVNLDHDHNKWFSYPRTRTDFSAANEFSVEATLRVDNQEHYLQQQLDHDPSISESEWINHPSIEGRPDPMGGYHFTGLALLRAGHELPGNPLSEIVPLMFNESVGKSICEFKGGKMVCECDTKQSEVKNNLKESVKEAIKEVLTESGLKEQEVPDATNAPSTVGKDDTATCPANHHWDPDAKKCVPDVKEECEAGWHFDVALEKCIPDNPQVNERLEIATLRVEAMHAKDEVRKKDLAIENLEKFNAEQTLTIEEQIKAIAKLEGEKGQVTQTLEKSESQKDRLIKEKIEDTKTVQKLQNCLDDLRESRDNEKTLTESIHQKYDKTVIQNQTLTNENVTLKSELTDARTKEVELDKENKRLRQANYKQAKYITYLLEKYGLEHPDGYRVDFSKTENDTSKESQPQTT